MFEISPANKESEDRLDSWKEIASFLGRDVRTVQRWEKAEGLPVHRHRHSKLDSIYAFKGELIQWQGSRRNIGLSPPQVIAPATPESVDLSAVENNALTLRRSRGLKVWAISAISLCVVTAGVLMSLRFLGGPSIHTNLIPVPLSTYLGDQEAPTFSPDGSKIAFVWNGEDQNNFDIYVKSVSSPQLLRLTTSADIDYSPAGSPDGKWIAFCRGTQVGEGGLWIVPASGGVEHRVSIVDRTVRPSDRALSWMPDGKFVVVSHTPGTNKGDGLYLVDVKAGTERLLTSPKPGEDDDAPAVSPNGKWIAFSRDTGLGISAVYLLPFDPRRVGRTEPKRLSWPGLSHVYAGNPAWTPDSKHVVFDSNKGGDHYLWIASVNRPGKASLLPYGNGLTSPTISRAGELAFAHEILNVNIWKLDLRALAEGKSTGPAAVIASTRIQDSPKVSPDGQRLVFASNRSGYTEIWTSSIDGANAASLTAMNVPVTGSPSWSPDGRLIAYDSRVRTRPQIFSIAAKGGKPVGLTDGLHIDVVPSFSPDGKGIYFSSNRSGEMQIWEMSLTGADAKQVTTKGGFAAVFSPDGEYLYYSRGNAPFSSLWQRQLSTGRERCIVSMVPNRSFVPVNEGVFYRSISPDRKDELLFLNFRSNTTKRLFTFEKNLGLGMAISPDHHYLFFAQEDQHQQDLQMVQGFWR